MPSRLFRFFVFTCRDPRTDFRLPLVEALRREYDTYYVWIRRRPLVSGPGSDDPPREMSLTGFLRLMRRFRNDARINVYFNSTNTYFPAMTALLRGVMVRGVWCLDMHDDLRYHNTGLKRRMEGLIIALLRRLSDVTVHAAPTLQELFPDSRHLGNASNIRPLARQPCVDDGVLVIASFDERFDFDFLSDVVRLCPDMQFHLYGWTRADDTATLAKITAMAARDGNVHYHGSYATADLPGILGRFRVSVAPYRIRTPITRYIDPLRFYHCLNGGLEVVSTDIPQARYLSNWIHVVSDATACAETLIAIRSGALAKQPGYKPITWEQRADRLVDILQACPLSIRLAQRLARQATASGSSAFK